MNPFSYLQSKSNLLTAIDIRKTMATPRATLRNPRYHTRKTRRKRLDAPGPTPIAAVLTAAYAPFVAALSDGEVFVGGDRGVGHVRHGESIVL